MANKIQDLESKKISRENIGQFVYGLKQSAKDSRRGFERRWYDNNFFDDGFHYRYVSRQQNKIVDLSEGSNLYMPYRAIPKASRQIRGVANLLTSPKYVPVIYPEKILKENYSDPNEFTMALEGAKIAAKRQGHWVMEEFKNQGMTEKLAFMIILAAKQGISYMEIWPDAVKEKIESQVYDAFDIYLMSNNVEIYDSPFLTKSVPRLISLIKADERFDPIQVLKITPDNKMASSDIKEAYARARWGGERRDETSVTVIQDETFIKEYLNDEATGRIKLQENAEEILSGKKKGDMVMRQVFTAGNVWLSDKYVNLPEYPFVDFRMEPGPIYGVPLIERFIPVNKSLDMAVSRLERFFHTMNVGVWLKRQGEQIKFTNQSGGQVVEYAQTKPEQATVASPSAMSFPFVQFLSNLIEEQGVSTSTTGRIPAGARATSTIEALKESEIAALQIPMERLRQTVKRIAERLLEYADDYFVNTKTSHYLEQGEPQYFDVIGSTAMKKRKQLGVSDGIPEGTVPLKKGLHVDIQVEQGLAFTSEGKKARAREMLDSLLPYAQAGFISPEAFKQLLQSFLTTLEYGNVSDIIGAMDSAGQTEQLTQEKKLQIKTAVLEVLKEAGLAGPQAEQQRVDENKFGVLSALKESGVLDKLGVGKVPEKGPSESISFKDLPSEGKIQMA
ncbi:MAG: hypothetical protein AAB922_01795, partial [Patescibacteria group bacterium]